MKKFALLLVLAAAVASCRRSYTCDCRNRDGLGSLSKIEGNKKDGRDLKEECAKWKVQESDGSLSPCKFSE